MYMSNSEDEANLNEDEFNNLLLEFEALQKGF